MARRTYLKRQKQIPAQPVTDRGIRCQLSWAAGAEYFQNRDPLQHVTEAFRTSFDRSGRQRAWEAGKKEQQKNPQNSGQSRDRTGRNAEPSFERFSETAFQRGGLAGAVLQGTGRVMLTSCIKRTVGQSEKNIQQRTLSGLGAKKKNVPGAPATQVTFHRGFVNSAVGVTVDALQDARRTVELMERMVQGKGGIGEHEGRDTLRTLYPFLDQSREKELLEQYRQQLGRTENVQEKALLQSAIVRTEALMDKKTQMKTEFIQKLREISDRANEALREFQEPDFVDSLMQDLTEGDRQDGSHNQPENGGPDKPEPPDGGENPPERHADSNSGAAGGSGGDESGTVPAGAPPAAGR